MKRKTGGIRNIIRHPVVSFPGTSIRTQFCGAPCPTPLGQCSKTSLLSWRFISLTLVLPLQAAVFTTLSLCLSLTLCSPPSSSRTHTHTEIEVSSPICQSQFLHLRCRLVYVLGQVKSFGELHLRTDLRLRRRWRERTPDSYLHAAERRGAELINTVVWKTGSWRGGQSGRWLGGERFSPPTALHPVPDPAVLGTNTQRTQRRRSRVKLGALGTCSDACWDHHWSCWGEELCNEQD